jgi:hypothetical protein
MWIWTGVGADAALDRSHPVTATEAMTMTASTAMSQTIQVVGTYTCLSVCVAALMASSLVCSTQA